MKKHIGTILTGILFMLTSCEDFLEKVPLDTPSSETYWSTPEQAELWVNNLYRSLGGVEESIYEAYSDNAFGRAGSGANNIANGSYETNDSKVYGEWDYRYIRLSHEFFENIQNVPNLPDEKLDELSGQVNFILAYNYYKLLTFFRDVPLVTKALDIAESDLPKSTKEEVFDYIMEKIDLAIETLPVNWEESESGRATKGAALALKSRVLLYNEKWSEAADTAQKIIDLDVYELHPKFEELFRWEFNNQTKEVILAKQYAETANVHDIVRRYAPYTLIGHALILPTAELGASFQMSDGLSIQDSPLYDTADPFKNRDPRFYHTFLYHGAELNGDVLDLTGTEARFAFTYLYYRKYIGNLANSFWPSHVNWTLFRYADVLLMYAEARNEASGPDDTVYDALDLIRERAGMPAVDRSLYGDKASLRNFIRNERRVELAGEGLRYFDILRWRTAEEVLNIDIKSMDLSNWADGPVDGEGSPILIEKPVQSRTFNPSRNYVWPIPQQAIDQAKNLKQHTEWQ